MLGECRRDPVEAALDPLLPNALLEAGGVAYCERGEAGERLEQVRLDLPELPLGSRVATPRMPRRSPDQVIGAADRAREPLVGLCGTGSRNRSSGCARRGELELDELGSSP